MARSDKLVKLIAVFDGFHQALAALDDPMAKRLVVSWNSIRHQYVEPSGAPRSAYVAGMEQGLREMPMLLRSMNSDARTCAVQALAAATLAHYPEHLAKNAERLAKIWARGSIRSESEFHLVRHHVDLLESESSKNEELRLLYELVDGYERREA